MRGRRVDIVRNKSFCFSLLRLKLKQQCWLFSFWGIVMAEPQLLLNYTGHLPECPTWSAEE
ncbi:hypothetical protein, partial [Enterobacter hormaechei]|uniref:hypothetical protein n=1 Tax=Enterobacter hormaechei TaxID=158836 RepID=UPI003F65D67E